MGNEKLTVEALRERIEEGEDLLRQVEEALEASEAEVTLSRIMKAALKQGLQELYEAVETEAANG